MHPKHQADEGYQPTLVDSPHEAPPPVKYRRHWFTPRRAPDVIIGGEERPYLLRWFIIPRNRWFNAYYHVFKRSDDDRAIHDHPWASASLCLSGRCLEYDGERVSEIRRGRVRLRRATYRHRIIIIAGEECHTLFLTGPRVREWGFWCPQGFVPWRKFTSGPNGERAGRGCDQ